MTHLNYDEDIERVGLGWGLGIHLCLSKKLKSNLMSYCW